MVRVADAAGMRRGSSGRQRERDERPGQRKQQQEYGSAATHVFQEEKTTPVEISLEQKGQVDKSTIG